MGYGVDVRSRAGVPRERGAGARARGELPEPQRGAAVLSRSGLRAPTPVFGTAQPAHGLSGVVRRAAYRVPEHRTGRWALLFLGDRIDVLEHRIARGWWVFPAAAALALGYVAASRALDRR